MQFIKEIKSLIIKYTQKPETSINRVIMDLKELIAIKRMETKNYTENGTTIIKNEVKRHHYALRKYKKEFPSRKGHRGKGVS